MAYAPPYERYDMTAADPEDVLDPSAGFYAVLMGQQLVGFRSFGADGRVPGWDYDDSALDTGGGLRPELTGRGWGREVIATGLAFGAYRFHPPAFRVTVALVNERALHTVESLGFQRVARFSAAHDHQSYAVLTLNPPFVGDHRPRRRADP